MELLLRYYVRKIALQQSTENKNSSSNRATAGATPNHLQFPLWIMRFTIYLHKCLSEFQNSLLHILK